MSSEQGSGDGSQPSSGATPSRRARWAAAFGPSWIAGIASALVVSTIVALTAFLLHEDAGENTSLGTAGAALELQQLLITNGPAHFESVGEGQRQTRASTPRLDLTVLNPAARRVLITEARVTIRAFAALPVCTHAGEAIQITSDYGIVLPPRPRRGRRPITKPLHQQIAPDSVDRFVLAFRNSHVDQFNPSLYSLRIALKTSRGAKSLPVGNVILALPGAVYRDGSVIPEDDRYLSGVSDTKLDLPKTWCYRRNLAEIARILRAGGQRSAEVEALKTFVPAPTWETARDRTPPRQSAAALLKADEPTLAVFAAQRTDDDEFVARIRRTAGARLLARARDELGSTPQRAIELARESLAIIETADGASLLRESERRAAESSDHRPGVGAPQSGPTATQGQPGRPADCGQLNGGPIQTVRMECRSARRLAATVSSAADCRPRHDRDHVTCAIKGHACELYPNVDPSRPWSARCQVGSDFSDTSAPWVAFYVASSRTAR